MTQTQFQRSQPLTGSIPNRTAARRHSLSRVIAAATGGLLMGLVGGIATSGIANAAPQNSAQTQISDDWQLCRGAAQKVERANGLPDALLQAMSLVETGRRAPDGRHTAWPWTINAEGRGFRFASKPDALLAVRRLMADGVRSIDVGCMQVNLRYHPRAFTSLDEAFDPAANMAYAASFLQDLKNRHGDWRAASARYHSYNPKLREKYATRVDKTLARERKVLAANVPATPPAPAPAINDTGDAAIITASTAPAANLGLRPSLIPGLRRGLDMPASPDAPRDAAALAPAPAAHATQLAAR